MTVEAIRATVAKYPGQVEEEAAIEIVRSALDRGEIDSCERLELADWARSSRLSVGAAERLQDAIRPGVDVPSLERTLNERSLAIRAAASEKAVRELHAVSVLDARHRKLAVDIDLAESGRGVSWNEVRVWLAELQRIHAQAKRLLRDVPPSTERDVLAAAVDERRWRASVNAANVAATAGDYPLAQLLVADVYAWISVTRGGWGARLFLAKETRIRGDLEREFHEDRDKGIRQNAKAYMQSRDGSVELRNAPFLDRAAALAKQAGQIAKESRRRPSEETAPRIAAHYQALRQLELDLDWERAHRGDPYAAARPLLFGDEVAKEIAVCAPDAVLDAELAAVHARLRDAERGMLASKSNDEMQRWRHENRP